MNSPAEDVAGILVTNTLGTFGAVTGWAIYVSREPENPDTTITVYDTAGRALEGLAGCPEAIDDFRIQIRIRANGHQAAWDKLKAIENVLNFIVNETIGDTTYQTIYRNDTGFLLEFDEKDRIILVQNYAGIRQLT